MLREIRELSEAIILIDQRPALIAPTALGNTYCAISMNLKHRADVKAMADACLLTRAQEELVGRLDIGEAVVKLQGRWTLPFTVEFEHLPLEQGSVTDAELHRTTGAAVVSHSPPAQRPASSVSDIPPAPPKQKIEGAERAFLTDISEHPGSAVTDRYARVGLSRRRGTQLKQQLVRTGHVKEIAYAWPGGRVTFLEPTEL